MQDWVKHIQGIQQVYGNENIVVNFVSNHDENSWNGTIEERFGDAGLTYFVLASTYGNGMPLIYSGQEMGLNHRLSFFGKDQIKWERPELGPFYARSLELKHKNPALWNGNFGGPRHGYATIIEGEFDSKGSAVLGPI